MNRKEKGEAGCTTLATTQHELRIETVAHLETEKAADVTAKTVVDSPPISMWTQALIQLIQHGTDFRKPFLDNLGVDALNGAFDHTCCSDRCLRPFQLTCSRFHVVP